MAEEARHSLVAPPRAGRTDRWLSDELNLSRGQVVALIEGGHVTVDGATVKPARSPTPERHLLHLFGLIALITIQCFLVLCYVQR